MLPVSSAVPCRPAPGMRRDGAAFPAPAPGTRRRVWETLRAGDARRYFPAALFRGSIRPVTESPAQPSAILPTDTALLHPCGHVDVRRGPRCPKSSVSPQERGCLGCSAFSRSPLILSGAVGHSALCGRVPACCPSGSRALPPASAASALRLRVRKP